MIIVHKKVHPQQVFPTPMQQASLSYGEWQTHFCIIPRCVEGEWFWLKQIYKRRQYVLWGQFSSIVYGTLADVMRTDNDDLAN